MSLNVDFLFIELFKINSQSSIRTDKQCIILYSIITTKHYDLKSFDITLTTKPEITSYYFNILISLSYI